MPDRTIYWKLTLESILGPLEEEDMRCGVLALGWGYSTVVEHSSCLPSLGQALGSILCNEETKQNKRTGDLVSAVRGMSELTVEGKRKDTPPTGRIAGARQGQHGIEEQEMNRR